VTTQGPPERFQARSCIYLKRADVGNVVFFRDSPSRRDTPASSFGGDR
jgi:hypothetical protein